MKTWTPHYVSRESLERQGWSVFWDRTIPAGKTWRDVIGAALDDARCVVVLWSRNSISSDWVLEEADHGLRRHVLIPAFIESVDPPLGFGSIHAADLSTWAGDQDDMAIRQFLDDVAGILGPAPVVVTPEERHQVEAQVRRKSQEQQRQQAEAEAKRTAETRHQPALQVELAREESLASAGAISRPEPAVRTETSGHRIRKPLVVASTLALGVIIGGAGVWILPGRDGETPAEHRVDGLNAPQIEASQNVTAMLEKELQQREIEIEALNSRVTDAKAEAAQLQNQLVVEERESEKLRKQLAEARRWSDCEKCPWMVSLPGGPFTMGSPENEDGHDHDEEPAREVTVQPFAIGQYEVTFDEWDTCVADGACLDRPKEADWGNRPVINVSWNDAKEYVVWLSKKTRQFYRLPSEAEWEYAARAGAGTRYWWGNQASPEHANYDGNVGEPTDVGSYPANPFGLYDMHGNVWEWVEDCWHASYGGAPSDGSAWRGGNCSFRVVRGGSWNNRPWNVRSATREGQKPINQSRYLGIRVARTLTP